MSNFSIAMILRAIVIATASVMALLAMVSYSPLVDGIDDRYRALLFMGYFKLSRVTPCFHHIPISFRLTPKHPFPVPVHDCLDVTRYVLKHGKIFGIDVNRVGVAGESTGGNLAAAVALRLSSEVSSGLPPLKFQAVLYAPLQALDFRLPSYVEMNESMPVLGSHRMAAHWALYMGLELSEAEQYSRIMQQNRHVSPQLLYKSKYSEYISHRNLPEKFRKPRPHLMRHPALAKVTTKTDKLSSRELQLFNKIKHHLTNPMMSPLMAPNLKGLPPSLVVVAEFDVLRDDGLLYAHRLREAGTKVEVFIGQGYHADFLQIFPDYFHSRTGAKVLQTICNFVRQQT
ncbi:arylacetamide deacetylase-like 4 [Plakobranchus ocellatus]|uniref:Arylacetamide deacetylase-like 4 n=1 Tax=Plakobranchus ocellatus TaxID=259542 RepID=A0AAV4ANC2_9GAST|nr:arylacetamide deacetylase-like 4 [Plakobranchus ocellatus]